MTYALVCLVALVAAGLTLFAKRFGGLGAGDWPLVAAACASAFLGSYVGARLVKRVTLGAVHAVVGAGLVLVGVAMGAGLV